MNTSLATLVVSIALAGQLACEESGTAPAARVAVLAPTPTPAPPADAPSDPLDCGRVLASQHRGVAYAHSTRQGGYGSDASQVSLAELAELGVDSITITPFGWMEAIDSTDVIMRTEGRGESDASLRAVAAQADTLGLRVVMKPHLWLRGGGWRGDIAFADEADWNAWFASYTRFIVHYARLSEELGLDLLVVGVELRSSSAARESQWRDLIQTVREVYDGPLTYAANWDEAESVPFWDALDYIGIQMFAPLATATDPTPEELVVSAQAYLGRYSALSKAFDRPLLLTEVGFRAIVGTAVSPWIWPERGDDTPATAADQTAQVDAYCAIIRTFGRSERVAGMYWWKWFSNTEHDDGPNGFSPRGQPALAVLRHAFALQRE